MAVQSGALTAQRATQISQTFRVLPSNQRKLPVWKSSCIITLAHPSRVEVCRFLQVKRLQRTMGTTLHVAILGPRTSRCTHTSAGCVSHILSWQGILPGQWALQLVCTTPYPHTGAVESITGISIIITRNWLEEGMHDEGCCGRIAG